MMWKMAALSLLPMTLTAIIRRRRLPSRKKSGGGYTVKAIGYDAFDGCYWLEEVTLPKSLEKISWYAFAGCENLQEINIPYGVSVIGKGAFSDCYELTTVNLPDSLVQIDGHAFQNCKNLVEITVPAGVERLTNYVFGGCYSLKKVNVKGRNTRIYRWAFANDGYDVPFISTLDTDNVVFTCWPGRDKNSRTYSPEMFAVQTDIKNIRFYEEEVVRPPVTVPAPPTVAEIPKDVVEIGYPVVIVPNISASEGEYKDGGTYSPETNGFVIKCEPQEVKDTDDTDDTCTRKFEMVPCDAHGNELTSWKGRAYIFFFYKDFVINGKPLTKESVALYNFNIVHEYDKGKFEYFDNSKIFFEDDGFRVEIKSLSPFTVTVDSNVGNVDDVPQTGDNSMNLLALFAMFVLSAAAVKVFSRRRA